MAATLAVGLLATGWVPQFGEGLKKVFSVPGSLLGSQGRYKLA